MDDQRLVYTLDEALTYMGFGKFQVLALVYSGLGWFSEAMEVMILSFVGSAVKSEWGLSSTQESLITTVVFAGMLVGAYSWGLISDNYGRRMSILGGAMLTFVAGLLSAFSPNYISLLIFRSLAGAGLGSGHVFFSWFLEFVPPSKRGMWMVVFSTFWTFGSVSEAALAWIIMPTLNWRWLLALSAIPAFVVLIFIVIVPESPRYLCTKGRITGAHNILEKIAQFNRASLPAGNLISDRTNELDEESATLEETPLLSSTRDKTTKPKSGFSSFLMLFSPRLFKTTILLWLLYFGNSFVYYGIVLLASELTSTQSKCSSSILLSENVQDATVYMDVFITSLAELPGLLIAAIIVDRVGRKLSMTIMFTFVCIFLLPLVTQQSNFWTTALLSGARMFSMGTFIIANIFAPEIYPTSMRSTGSGVAYAMGRIGGIICPLVAVGLVTSCHQTAAIIVLEAVIVLSVVSILRIPFETMGKELTNTKMADDGQSYTVDEALTSMGFGKFQYLVFAYAGLAVFAEAMEIMIFSFIGPAVKSEWGVSPSEESLLTTVVFAGNIIGVYLWGLISDNFGRKKGFLGIAMITSGIGLLSAFSPNYISLVTLRGLVGIGIGSGPVFSAWFLEFVPAAKRGMWMVIFSTFWTLGSIFEAALAWIVMTTLNWRWLLALSSIPSFAVLLLYNLAPESPRYLNTKGRTTEVHHILEKIALFSKAKLPNGLLVSEATTRPDEEFSHLDRTPLVSSNRTKIAKLKSGFSSFFLLFSPRLIRTTLLLWMLLFGISFTYYGIILLTSKLSSMQSKCGSTLVVSQSMHDSSLYLNVFLASLGELPGLVFAGIIVDRAGRKLSLTIMLILVFICILPLAMLKSDIVITGSLVGARMFAFGASTIACILTAEIYPTSTRTTGAAAANSVGKFGGMVCPLVAVGLVTGCHQSAVVILFEAAIVFALICVIFIPFETKGRELSDTVDGVSTSEQATVVG